ncbi:PREDICTED: putative cytochrome b561 [Priapulus caudatus]|uniref:Cytochrome b561 n=1 Tax=Priapulus caudatus TaxID=37621 RepID=A0ABM1FAT6_PRICU|nr:PREDICTED: putative cytochrome b561 [Priapulus caudatus]XP_014681557.1 PREDICTED: putative cytochrome b561 [Priapulus caudatus]
MEKGYSNMEGGSGTSEQVVDAIQYFTGCLGMSQALGVLTIILTLVWTCYYRGGFAWHDDVAHEFNYHPLFMILGLVFFYAEAILVYRVFRNVKKLYVKLLHASLHFLAIIFVIVALKAVFDSHNLAKPTPHPNLYSLHSWLGLSVVLLFGLQYVSGFVSFLFPKLSLALRQWYMPTHVFFGIAIFLGAIATALMGLTEKLLFLRGDMSTFRTAEGTFINILGLLLVAFAGLVIYLVINPKYKRQPLPEEEMIQLSQD